jgi:hypothetical protein
MRKEEEKKLLEISLEELPRPRKVKRSEAPKPLHIWESICRFSVGGEICGSRTRKNKR